MSTIYTLTKNLREASTVESADVVLILSFILKRPKEYILAHPEHELSKEEQKKLQQLLERRGSGEPLAYIFGKKEFFGKDFRVTPDTLIPRPETELLVEETVEHLLKNENKKTILVDVGTGSGCIIASVVSQLRKLNSTLLQDIKFYGLDISKQSLDIAIKNAKCHNVLSNIVFLRSNLLEYLLHHPSLIKDHTSLIVVANLPYVPSAYLQQKKTKLTKGLSFEPSLALDGGKDGFDLYRSLLDQIRSLRKLHSHIIIHCLFEIGNDQKLTSKKNITSVFPHIKISSKKDLSGQIRMIKFSLD